MKQLIKSSVTLTNLEIPTGPRYGWMKGLILINSPQVASYVRQRHKDVFLHEGRSRGSVVDFHWAHRQTSRQTEENFLKLWPVLHERTTKVSLEAFQFGVIKGPIRVPGEEFGLLWSGSETSRKGALTFQFQSGEQFHNSIGRLVRVRLDEENQLVTHAGNWNLFVTQKARSWDHFETSIPTKQFTSWTVKW